MQLRACTVVEGPCLDFAEGIRNVVASPVRVIVGQGLINTIRHDTSF
jgi:hypothetical protein